MQSREMYKRIIFDLILEYKIKVIRWRTTNSGCAYQDSWEVEIPKPLSLQRFITCLHEIGHCVKDKYANPQWKSEYIATKYAIDMCNKLDIKISEKELRNNLNYLTSCIADDITNNGIDIKKIDKAVLEYANIDIKLWKSKIKKGLYPDVRSVKENNQWGFYKIRIDWIKKKS